MTKTKLDRPPYVHNWVRYNDPDLVKTTKLLVGFATNLPQVTYGAGLTLIHDRIAFGLSRETAVSAALNRGHKKSRPYVRELVEAFYDFDETAHLSGQKNFDQFVEPYRVSPEIVIPVRPLIVLAEDGKLKPLFVVGWQTMPLTRFQCRLLMTVVEDAVFSLTDFQLSPGEFISFPRSMNSERAPLVWKRGDFDLLSDEELKEQLRIYLEGLRRAKAHLESYSPRTAETPTTETEVDPRQATFLDRLTQKP